MTSAFPIGRASGLAALLIAAICGGARPALADEGSSEAPPVMTLAAALVYAHDHQPLIRSALAEFAARRAESRIPRAGWLPQVGATVQLFEGTANNTTASYMSVPEVDLVRIGATKAQSSTSWSPSASTLAAVSIDQEVYDFGRIAAQASVADSLAAIARTNADAVALDVQLGVEESFHAVLAAKDVASATEEAYRRAVTHRDFAQAGVHSGLRPPIELTRAQADVARLEVRRIRTTTGLASARAALAASIAFDGLYVDAQPIAPDQTPGPAFEEALRTAARKNPLVVAALFHIHAQESTTRATTRELYPNLFASAGLSGRAGGAAPSSGDTPYGAGWLPDVANWHLGLVLQWNVFDGTLLAKRAASLAREDATRADLELARRSVTLEVERAYLDLDAAVKTLPGLGESVAAARANQAQADARFKAGLGTVVELADAEALLTSAQLELAIGQFTVARARAALGRVMGQSILSAEPGAGKKS